MQEKLLANLEKNEKEEEGTTINNMLSLAAAEISHFDTRDLEAINPFLFQH